jgi:cold shock CspA family protein
MIVDKTVAYLTVWFPERGYGFCISYEGDVTRYFLHVSNIQSGVPVKGSIVRFDVRPNSKGLLAVNAEIFPDREAMAHADAVVEATKVFTTPNSEAR